MAVVCTPDNLASLAACLKGSRKQEAIQAYLLCQIANADTPVTCTPDSLAEDAACFAGMDPWEQAAAQVYLLAVIAGGSTSPDELAPSAACFAGMPPPQSEAAQTYLLSLIAGVSADPGDLSEAAKCFAGMGKPQLLAIQTYLLAIIANVELNADTLAAASACFDGIGQKQQDALKIYLLCQIENGSTPPGTEEVLLTGGGLGGAIGASVTSSTGFWAIEDDAATVTIFANGAGTTGPTASATVWPCASATDDTNSGSITELNVSATALGGPLDVTLLTSLQVLTCSDNQINDLNVAGIPSLAQVYASSNSLGETEVDAVLVQLNASGAIGGVCEIQNNAAPGAAGAAAAAALILKGWSITTD